MIEFKVMHSSGKEFPEEQVKSVPWEWVEKFEARALKNHFQSLKILHARGGLCPTELYAVVNDLSYREAYYKITEYEAIEWLKTEPWKEK